MQSKPEPVLRTGDPLVGRRSRVSVPQIDQNMVKTGRLIARLQNAFERFVGGDRRGLAEEHVEDMAEIIKTYRGVEMDDEENASFVDGLKFNLIMAAMTLANTAAISIEIDATDISQPPELHWLAIEGALCFVFVAEVLLRLRCHGWRWLFLDLWNLITFVVAAMLLVDSAIFGPLRVATCLKIVSLIRVFGLVRLRRKLRHVPALDDLRVVFEGVTVGSQAILWVVLLLTAVCFMSAIFLTRQIGHNSELYGNYRKLSGGWDHAEYFGTMPRSMYTLMQIMTLDGWSSVIVRPIISQQSYMIYFFAAFVLVTNYGVANVVVSVIVQHMCASAERTEARRQERAVRSRQSEIEKMIEVFVKVDKDDSGVIEYEEFLEAIARNPEVPLLMRALEMPVDNAAKLFSVLSGKGTRTLTKEEFVRGCTRMKGPAQSKDLLGIQAQADSLAKKLDVLNDNIEESERMLSTLDEITKRLELRYAPCVQTTRRQRHHDAGGAKPLVPPTRVAPGGDAYAASLATGNRPTLPLFPDLLH